MNRGQYWERPEGGEPDLVPEVDRDGDRWDPDWPALGVSWHDAQAFVAWHSEQTGAAHALPTDLQWEKAARGVDGRLHPWGDRFDPTLCKMRLSRPGRHFAEPIGSFPTDVGVYGAHDMAGSIRDWCGDKIMLGESEYRPVRGGSWFELPELCRGTARFLVLPWLVNGSCGFRLARKAPRPG